MRRPSPKDKDIVGNCARQFPTMSLPFSPHGQKAVRPSSLCDQRLALSSSLSRSWSIRSRAVIPPSAVYHTAGWAR